MLWIIFPFIIFKMCILQLKEIYPTLSITIGVKTEPNHPRLSRFNIETNYIWNDSLQWITKYTLSGHSEVQSVGRWRKNFVSATYITSCFLNVDGGYSCGTWLSSSTAFGRGRFPRDRNSKQKRYSHSGTNNHYCKQLTLTKVTTCIYIWSKQTKLWSTV